MHVFDARKPGFIYSASGSLTKNKERIQSLKKNRAFKKYLSKRTRQSLL